MPKTKNKGLLVIALVAILAAATTVNYKLSEKSSTASTDTSSSGVINAELVNNSYSEEDVMTSTTGVDSKFFSEYRTQRENTRSKNISLLEGIVSDSTSTSEMVNNAQQEIINLTKLSEKEMVVENLIKAKGFKDVIVFIHEGYVNVVVDATQLTTAQASQIQDIAVKECSVEASKVCIAVSKAKE